MRDFRVIRDFEVKWKNNQEQLEAMRDGNDMEPAQTEGAPDGNLEEMLNEMLEERGLTDDGYF